MLWWKFHPANVRLAKNTFYEIDFLVLLATGELAIYETYSLPNIRKLERRYGVPVHHTRRIPWLNPALNDRYPYLPPRPTPSQAAQEILAWPR